MPFVFHAVEYFGVRLANGDVPPITSPSGGTPYAAVCGEASSAAEHHWPDISMKAIPERAIFRAMACHHSKLKQGGLHVCHCND
jgi:hypothetical protein